MKWNISGSLKLIMLFFLSLVLWLITSINSSLNILWFLVVLVLSIIFIVRYKNITKGNVAVGILLDVISMPSNFFMGLFTIIAYIGGVSVFKASKNKILLVKSNSRKDVTRKVLLAVFVGIILGAANIYLGTMNMTINPSIKLKWVLDAIRAGVAEEVIFRFFFFAICIHFIA